MRSLFAYRSPPQELCQSVKDHGWLLLALPRSKGDLGIEVLNFARRLGQPISGRKGELVESLRPAWPEEASPRSLSAIHGMHPFPFHTDGAHYSRPPRYLVLACISPGTTVVPTVLNSFKDLGLTEHELARCRTATFLIKNGRRSFYSTILDSMRGFVRFDEACMTPTSADAATILEVIRSRLIDREPVQIRWRSGDAVVLDNWRILHGRGSGSSVVPTDRHMLRVSIQ
jgi:Taurine catabolism dioxygenase TauD, TfdA family